MYMYINVHMYVYKCLNVYVYKCVYVYTRLKYKAISDKLQKPLSFIM